MMSKWYIEVGCGNLILNDLFSEIVSPTSIHFDIDEEIDLHHNATLCLDLLQNFRRNPIFRHFI